MSGGGTGFTMDVTLTPIFLNGRHGLDRDGSATSFRIQLTDLITPEMLRPLFLSPAPILSSIANDIAIIGCLYGTHYNLLYPLK